MFNQTKIIFFFFVLFCNRLSTQGFLFSDEQRPKIGIVVSAFNREEFLSQTLNALQEKKFGTKLEVEIVIIDDCSGPGSETLIDTFHLHNILVIRARVPKNAGIAKALSLGWEILLHRNCDFLCNLDSDVLLKDNWLQEEYEIYHLAKNILNKQEVIVTGFNTKNHPIKQTYEYFHIKKSIGGINLFFPTSLFEKYVKQALLAGHTWDWRLCDILGKQNIPLICTNPSVVQHIGFHGLNSRQNKYDYADDF